MASKYPIFSINWGNLSKPARAPLQKPSCPFKRGPPERWPSGLRRTLGKRVCGKPYRGFESHSLRHPSPCGLRVAGHPETDRAKGVSRSSEGAQGDWCRMWYVYFLELSNGDVYVGSTDDLRRRVASHQQGHVVSTSKYLPVVLRSYVAVADELAARKLERYFKSGSGKAFAKKRFLTKDE